MRADADFKALRFETDVVDLGTARLGENHESAAAIKDSLIEQIAELPLKVNVVAKEQELIEAVLRDSWWQDVTDEQLSDLVRRLGPLMKYRQRRTEPIMELDLRDLTVLKERIEFGPKRDPMSVSAYRERVEEYIRNLVAHNPVLQKIQAGEEIGEGGEELQELAELLQRDDPYVTENLLQRIYDNWAASFLDFMRHVLGLEVVESWTTTVSREFDRFIAEHNTFSSLQIRFLQTLRTFILQTRRLEKRHLVESPFTQLHPRGIRGVFTESEIDEILEFSQRLVA